MATTQILPERYQDIEPVAQGAMGTVFCATDTTLDRVVAVKLLAERYVADDAARRRFEREARAAARVSSEPNIVTIFDVGDAGGRPYIVMEYIAGSSLEERLRSGRQKPADAMRWLEQAGRALDYAHLKGVVHRDVKPGNLLLDRSDNVHVADFGIASAAWMPSLTVSGTILGTAGYLAPEQALGEPTSPASDRYALAVVSYELLTGTPPFARESPTAEAQAHVAEPVPSASARGNLPPEVDRVFQLALAKRPEQRYATCADFVSDLRTALAGAPTETRVRTAATVPLPRPAPLPRTAARSSSSRKPLLAVLVGAALLALVLAGVLIARPSGSEQTASPPAKPATHKQPKKHKKQTTTAPVTTAAEKTTPATTQAAPATTAASPPPTTTSSPPPTTTATPQPAAAGPHTLNDQAWGLMQQGRYEEALPLLQKAVPALTGLGPGDPAEGYANYNLGYTLVQLGSCSEGQTYLERAQTLEPDRKEVRKALREAEHCIDKQG
ncbi:MAG: protein kinase domain-containing protein [Gaiellaceae bacterium]